MLHHHLLPVPGTGRERNVVYDAGDAIECLQRAGVDLVLSGHKHVPYAWRLEDLFVVNTGTVSSLRLRGNTRPCYNVVEIIGLARRRLAQVPVPRAGADHPVLDRDARVREVHGADRGGGDDAVVNAIALIDGEHHGAVVRDALAELPYEFVGAILVGGTEKLRGGEDYGVPLVGVAGRGAGARSSSTSPTSRCSARASGCSGRAGRSRRGSRTSAPTSAFDRPRTCAAPTVPSLAVIGTGKRIGKTAVTGHVARLLSQRGDVVVVSMGRGGPREPEVVRGRADARPAPRHLSRGRARGLRLPRDRGARRRADDRLPARGRRARRRRVHVEPAARDRARRRAAPRRRRLRRQRGRDPARRGRRPRARRRAGAGRDRVPQRRTACSSPTSSC